MKLHIVEDTLLATADGRLVAQAMGKAINPVAAKEWARTIAEAVNTFDHIAQLQTRVTELESALRPFAALYYHGGIRADMPNNTPMCISLGDIRRAHAVLAKIGDPND